ncbi:MAG: SanA protein [Ruminococcaceae bacterium]|nr:SanA protein [Oscillospiraceae bacterium]
MKTKKTRRILLICAAVLAGLGIFAAAIVFGINAYVVNSTSPQILSPGEAAQLKGVDCILVLGCKVRDSGAPSAMLEDRLRRSVELFDAGAAPKLLMSGDHGTIPYNEVQAMKQYAIDKGIASEDIFMDHAGFSTYESLYRAKEIFQVKKIIIVTQEYHLYRALYIADALGIEAYGVHSNYRNYAGQAGFDVREVLARNKDVLSCIFLPKPTYLGEAIPIWGDGNLTND